MGGNEPHISQRSHTHKKRNEWPKRKRRNKDKIVGTTQRNIKQTRRRAGGGRGAIRRGGGNTLQRLTYFETVF